MVVCGLLLRNTEAAERRKLLLYDVSLYKVQAHLVS